MMRLLALALLLPPGRCAVHRSPLDRSPGSDALLGQDDEVVKRVLPEGAAPGRSKRAVDAERARAALGADPAAEVTVWTAAGSHPMSNRSSSQWSATVVRIDTPHGPADLAVAALLDEHMVARVRIAGLPADKVPTDFLRRLGGFEYAAGSLEQPVSTLEAAQKKAAEGKDAEALLMRALLHVRSSMSQVTPANSVIVDRILKKERKPAEAEALSKIFEEMSRSSDALTFLRDDQRKRLRDLSGSHAASARAAAAAIRAGDWKRADDSLQAISTGCAGCHGQFARLFRPERAKRGIGDGYFRVGFDVLAEPGADPKLTDAIAAGVRRALVLLSNAK